MIHHNLIHEKDHKEAALKAQELKAGNTFAHETTVAMHSTANGPQLEWSIGCSKIRVKKTPT